MKTVKMERYVDKLKEIYPDLDERIIKKVVNMGCHNIMRNLKCENDVMIESSRKKVKFVIYQYRLYTKEKARNAKISNKQV